MILFYLLSILICQKFIGSNVILQKISYHYVKLIARNFLGCLGLLFFKKPLFDIFGTNKSHKNNKSMIILMRQVRHECLFWSTIIFLIVIFYLSNNKISAIKFSKNYYLEILVLKNKMSLKDTCLEGIKEFC